jgi:hypothetical protein
MGYSGVVGTGVSTMISQERKNKLKNEGKSEKLQKKILIYDNSKRILRRFPFIAILNIIFVVIIIFLITLSTFSFLSSEMLFFEAYSIIYTGFIMFILGYSIQKLKKLSQPMACYAAVSAAEQLENDNLIEASFCADKLLEALSILVKQKSIKVKPWKSPLKNLLYVQPRDIKNKAVHGAIQDSTATKNVFAEQFYDLADSLSKDLTSREFMAIRDFLEWLSGKSQTYESKIGFWARHQNYKILLDIMAIIAPIILSILMLISYWLTPAM